MIHPTAQRAMAIINGWPEWGITKRTHVVSSPLAHGRTIRFLTPKIINIFSSESLRNFRFVLRVDKAALLSSVWLLFFCARARKSCRAILSHNISRILHSSHTDCRVAKFPVPMSWIGARAHRAHHRNSALK